jgi:O-antigen/teichoic acid export membrane protein
MRGAAAAAIYTAATRFVVVGQIATQAVWYAVQPHLATLVARGNLVDARRLYRVSTTWLIALTWPLFLATLVAAPTIMRIFGTGYRSGSNVMIALSIAMLFSSACGIVDVVLITMGKTFWNLVDTAIALVINVGFDVALIPRFGVIGAAVAWALAIVAQNMAALVQVERGAGFFPLETAAMGVGLAAAASFAAAPLIAFVAFGQRPVVAGAVLAIGASGYGFRLWRTRRELHLDVLRRRP